jgi:LmbE family N-acetylglucosaminyl deacetylase
MTTDFEPVPESWDRALAVAAHPDDLEYGSSAAVARWTAQGKRISYCLVTSGEAGIDGLDPEVTGPLREQEQVKAAHLVGVSEIDFLRQEDGTLEYGLALRRAIARSIRVHRPEMVLTVNFHERWGHGALNQADHIAVGRAVIDAVRDAANRWVYRDLTAEGLAPWGGVQTVLAMGSPQAAHGVDVTGHMETGVASLSAHQIYLQGLGEHPMADPGTFLTRLASATGPRLGCEYAIPFEVFPMR